MSSSPAVRLRDAQLAYGRTPVAEVGLEVAAGELVGLVGPSGVGKTTVLRAVAGDPLVRDGAVEVRGHRAGSRGAQQHVGYVPQLGGVDRDFPLTVRQVVLSGRADRSRRLPWWSRAERRDADAVMDRLGILELADRGLRELSGGQQQRMHLARALVRRGDVLLLDEPTSGVDPVTRHRILGLLAELRRERGLTILLTTHDLNAVAALLPRVVCLAGGRVVADGPPAEVLDERTLAHVYGAPVRVLHDRGRVVVVDADDPIAAADRPAADPLEDAEAVARP